MARPPAQALRMAYRDGGMTMTALAQEIWLSVSRVSRLIAATKRERSELREARVPRFTRKIPLCSDVDPFR